MEIMKRTDEIRVDTEAEAKALIESFKEKAKEEAYEVVSYTSTLKEKKAGVKLICFACTRYKCIKKQFRYICAHCSSSFLSAEIRL